MSELTKRLNPGTTPKFWSRIRNIAGLLAAIVGAVLLAENQDQIWLSEWWDNFLKISGVILTTIAGTAHMTKR